MEWVGWGGVGWGGVGWGVVGWVGKGAAQVPCGCAGRRAGGRAGVYVCMCAYVCACVYVGVYV